MASYTEIYDVWLSGDLKKQVTVAVMKAATDILNEDPGTANHADRLVWAHAALLAPVDAANKMTSGVVMNATIQTGTFTDNDVQFVVNGLVDIFSTA